MKIEIEEFMSRLGNPGRYQVSIFILLALNYCPIGFHHVCMAFYGPPLPHTCISTRIANASSNVLEQQFGKCLTKYSLSDGTNITVDCRKDSDVKWRFDHTTGTLDHTTRQNTIVSEWDLVCDNAFLSRLATTIYFLGVMTGGVMFGFLADKFGRKPILLFTLYSQVVVGVVIAFSQNYIMFVVLRFVQGVLIQGLQISTYVLVLEMFLPNHRSYVGAVMECFWGATLMFLALVAYFLRDWMYLQLAISLPSALAVFYICVIPESLRWLIMKNKPDEAERLTTKIIKCNKLEYPKELWEDVKGMMGKLDTIATRRYTFIDTLRTVSLRKRTLVLYVLWFGTSLGYYGLTLNVTRLPGNKYLNFFISGLVEFVAYCLAIYIAKRFGRKKPLFVYFMTGGIACIAAGAIPNYTESGANWSTALALIGKFGTGGLWSLIFLFTSELYPTVIRNIGMGGCVFWTRVGGVLAPQVLLLGDLTHKSVPFIIFGVFMLIGGGMLLLLPETLGLKLPNTIDDAEEDEETIVDEKTSSPDTKPNVADENTWTRL